MAAPIPTRPLRILLPPNLAAAAPRNAIPLKIEGSPSNLPAVLQAACTGGGPWLLPMKRAELRALLFLLQGQPVFRWVNYPFEPLPWRGEALAGVSEHLAETEQVSISPGPPPQSVRTETETAGPGVSTAVPAKEETRPLRLDSFAKAAAREAATRNSKPEAQVPKPGPTNPPPAGADRSTLIAHIAARRPNLGAPRPSIPPSPGKQRSFRIPPMAPGTSASPTVPVPSNLQVDGSEHFLAIILPSRESHSYSAILEAVKNAGFTLEPSTRKWWLRDRHRTLTFLATHWERLEKGWGAQFTDNFRANTAKLRVATISTSITEAGGGFDVSLSLDAGGAPADLLKTQLAQGRGYIEHSGAVYLVPAATLDQLHRAQQALSGSPGTPLLPGARQRVPRHRAAELQEELEQLSPNFQPPEAWRQHSDALRHLTSLPPAPLDPSLAATLRSYQNLGVAWLHHLWLHSLGGVLADEMGLGKTAQAVALLSVLHARAGGPLPESSDSSVAPPGAAGSARAKPGNAAAQPGTSLVVCPASLTENWRRELARFAPLLRVFVHHGATRLATAPDGRSLDVVITSYGTLVRDLEMFAGAELRCLIADEAQHAKNRRSQAAAALRSLRAKARFCLTGTPVENSLDDLRSLFDIVLPGAVSPIPTDARGDERLWHEKRLHRQTAPYILRRTKIQVAPELPAKIEQVLWCELTDKQRACYDEVRVSTDREIDALAYERQPEAQVRLAVLTQLLRLRQVCCDPRLIEKPEQPSRYTAADSAKLAVFRELLAEALDDGHRLLVFSQFTRLLGMVREELAAQEIAHCYLDGSLTPKARQAQVDRFQGDAAIPVFLISLKAGGTGLNLTGADVVIHLDPWWNPAAEAQATDRAHRIGQTRVVTSYKLVVTGTVEEKVLQLQDTKRQLLAEVFDASDALNSRLELSDLRALVG
jgi:superfamily II DNA or RNA helicase